MKLAKALSSHAPALNLLLADRQLLDSIGKSIDPQQADEALQTLAERLINPGAAVPAARPYLRRAARNAAIDLWRSEHCRAEHEARFSREQPAFDARTPERAALAREKLAALLAALEALPALTQEIFLLHHAKGHTQSDIAACLKLHVSTVEKRLAKARRHCMERLSAYL